MEIVPTKAVLKYIIPDSGGRSVITVGILLMQVLFVVNLGSYPRSKQQMMHILVEEAFEFGSTMFDALEQKVNLTSVLIMDGELYILVAVIIATMQELYVFQVGSM